MHIAAGMHIATATHVYITSVRVNFFPVLRLKQYTELHTQNLAKKNKMSSSSDSYNVIVKT